MYNFNSNEKEIIIEKYNTPTPWMNYLSNGTFHTMMSQAGGGAIDFIQKTENGYEIKVKTSGKLKVYSENNIDVFVNGSQTDYKCENGVIDILIEKPYSDILIKEKRG